MFLFVLLYYTIVYQKNFVSLKKEIKITVYFLKKRYYKVKRIK